MLCEWCWNEEGIVRTEVKFRGKNKNKYIWACPQCAVKIKDAQKRDEEERQHEKELRKAKRDAARA